MTQSTPAEVWLLGQRFEFKTNAEPQPGKDEGTTVLAWVNFVKNEMNITDIDEPTLERSVFAHEVTHLILRATGANIILEQYEEYICEVMATGLISFFDSNDEDVTEILTKGRRVSPEDEDEDEDEDQPVAYISQDGDTTLDANAN